MKCSMMGMTLCLAVTAAWAQEGAAGNVVPQAAQDVAEQAVRGQVLVVGQRPGPGLWRVRKGDHVLHILGTYRPLPLKMEWRPQEVESVIAQSQEFIGPPSTSAQVGVLKGMTLLPHVFNIMKNPDGATLKDVLPADVHVRWLALKARYLGNNDGVERRRPLFAASELSDAAMRKSGLGDDREVVKVLDGLVTKYKLKRTPVAIKFEFDDPASLVKGFKKSSMDDVPCFSSTLTHLETNIDAMRVRANAWAKGDIEMIEKLDFSEVESNCSNAILSNSALKDMKALQEMKPRLLAKWLETAERALAENKSTFAVLRMSDVLRPNGYVAALAAKGYIVEKPE